LAPLLSDNETQAVFYLITFLFDLDFAYFCILTVMGSVIPVAQKRGGKNCHRWSSWSC